MIIKLKIFYFYSKFTSVVIEIFFKKGFFMRPSKEKKLILQ